jgi:hypothetical protein
MARFDQKGRELAQGFREGADAEAERTASENGFESLVTSGVGAALLRPSATPATART